MLNFKIQMECVCTCVLACVRASDSDGQSQPNDKTMKQNQSKAKPNVTNARNLPVAICENLIYCVKFGALQQFFSLVRSCPLLPTMSKGINEKKARTPNKEMLRSKQIHSLASALNQ